MSIDCISFITKIFRWDESVFTFSQMPSLQNPDLKTPFPCSFSSFCCENIAVIGYTFGFRHLSKCQPQMTLWTCNYYDVIFLPKRRTQIWGKIDLGGYIFEWEAIPKDTNLRCKITRIWGYSNFIGHGFVGRHIFEEWTRIWGRTWIWVLHIYRSKHEKQKLRDQTLIMLG